MAYEYTFDSSYDYKNDLELTFNKKSGLYFMNDDNIIHSVIILEKETWHAMVMDIMVFIIKCFRNVVKLYKKVLKIIVHVCERLYDSLEYSEAKTFVGLSIVLCFVTMLTVHLFFCLVKKHNRVLQLEREIQQLKK
jgi:hypothetical protein